MERGPQEEEDDDAKNYPATSFNRYSESLERQPR